MALNFRDLLGDSNGGGLMAPLNGLLSQPVTQPASMSSLGFLTPTNVGQTYGDPGEDSRSYSSDYERLFGGDVYGQAQQMGYTGAVPVDSGAENAPQQFGNPQQELFDWMRASGNTYGLLPTVDGGQINAWADPTGRIIPGTVREFQGGDKNFGVGMTLLSMAGGNILGPAMGLGSIGTGALTGAMTAGSQDPELSNVLRGAAVGGLMGGAKDYLAPSGYSGLDYGDGSAFPAGDGSAWTPSGTTPLSPMEVPSYEWQNSRLPEIQSPTQTLDPSGTIPSSWNTPLLNPSIQPTVPELPLMEVPSQAWQNPLPSTLPQAPTQTLDPSGTLPMPDVPQASYSNEGNNYPTPESTQGPGGSPVNATSTASFPEKLLDYMKANPRLVAGLAGGLLGGLDGKGGGSGGYSYSGPMPTITRGGWSPTATPTYAQPAAQPLLNRQPGQANSGLWRFMGGGQ